MRERVKRLLASELSISLFLGACAVGAIGHFGLGCSGWDPRRPFEKNNAEVDRAIEMIEAGQYENAEEVLRDYLGAGTCESGKIKLPEKLAERADGTYDLGLVLFHLSEKYGERFGDEKKMSELPGTVEELESLKSKLESRTLEIKCALIVALAVAKDAKLPAELRARAFYLAGNLQFLGMDYRAAILGYEQSLKLVPGAPEEVRADGIGRDAAWNRAVALRRLEEEKEDAGGQDESGDQGQQPQPQPQPNPSPGDQDQDGGEPNEPDGPDDGGGPDAGDRDGQDAGDAGEKPADEGLDGGEDAGPDAGEKEGGEPDAGDEQDGGQGDPQDDPGDSNAPKEGQGEPKADGSSSKEQGDRVLDRFDQVPTYQQEEAKKRADGRRRTEDK